MGDAANRHGFQSPCFRIAEPLNAPFVLGASVSAMSPCLWLCVFACCFQKPRITLSLFVTKPRKWPGFSCFGRTDRETEIVCQRPGKLRHIYIYATPPPQCRSVFAFNGICGVLCLFLWGVTYIYIYIHIYIYIYMYKLPECKQASTNKRETERRLLGSEARALYAGGLWSRGLRCLAGRAGAGA